MTALAWCAHFAAPSDMYDHDQLKPAGYMLDIVLNGAWAAQTDFEGNAASKPPLFPWLAAVVAHVTGRVDDFAMYLPSGLALLVASVLTALVCARFVGRTAAVWAVLAFVLNPLITKHLCLARADAVFTGTIAVAGWSLAMSVLARLRGDRAAAGRWILAFWVGATLATLAKGPLGLLLASSG
ncbi:MAG: glycosyltransferase family 39 protein, partial [bacterium]|nr:glycosyltransferase family 39 protein [bacterium]